jgi:hypothetical protein
MKDQFRKHLADYVTTNLGNPFDSLTDKQRSVWMARFYADQIVRPVNPAIVPDTEEDLEECSVDGANDCGVDFISRAGNVVLIIQAKYAGNRKRARRPCEDPADFDSFAGVLSRLYAGPDRYQMNAHLREAIVDVDWDHDTFDLRYVTLRQPGANCEAKAHEGIDTIPELPDLSDRSAIEILSEEQLNIELRDAQNISRGAPEQVDLLFTTTEQSTPYLLLQSERQALVGRISGSQVAELYRRHHSRLFALNLRNYVGDNATNRGIRQTAISESHEFFFFNNGISALAARIHPDATDPRRVSCEGFSIINGAQTVRSLHKAQALNPEALRGVQVLIRVSEIGKKRNQQQQAFLDKVTKFNNTQNAIKLADFRSNDPVQEDLAARFYRMKARSGKKILYKNKRTGEPDRTKITINMEEFTKTVFSFLWGPPDVFGGTGYLFDPGKDGGYTKLFGDTDGEIKMKLTTEEFSRFAGIWFACEYGRILWRRSAKEDSGALERRWLYYYALGEAIRRMYGMTERNVDEALIALADPTWLDSAEKKATRLQQAIEQFSEIAFRALKKVYTDATRHPNFRHRNWFRSEQTLRELDSQLDDYCSFARQASGGYQFG